MITTMIFGLAVIISLGVVVIHQDLVGIRKALEWYVAMRTADDTLPKQPNSPDRGEDAKKEKEK